MSEHETEHYQVQTEYTVEDRAAPVLERIMHASEHAAHGMHSLREKFHEFRMEQRFTMAAMFGVGFGLSSWTEKAKEANSQFAQVRRGISGVLSEFLDWPKTMAPLERYNRSLKLANETTEKLEESSEKYAIPLQDLGQGYRQMSAALAPLHLSQQQVIDVTEKTAAAAKVAQVDFSQAAELVGRAVMNHQVRPIGILGKELHNAFSSAGKLRSHMTGMQSLKLVERTLGDMSPTAVAMSQTIGDNLFRMQVQVEKVFRRLTQPLFQVVTKEIGEWSHKVGEFGNSGKSVLDTWGGKLVEAFHTLKDVTVFMLDHWKQIAAIWGSFKVAGMMSSAAGGLGGLAAALGGGTAMGGIAGTLGKGFGALGASIVPVVAGFAALKIALDAFLGWVDSKLDEKQRIQLHGVKMSESFGTLQHVPGMGPLSESQAKQGQKAVKDMIESGILSAGNKQVDKGAFFANLSQMSEGEKEAFADRLGLLSKYDPFTQKLISGTGVPVGQMSGGQFLDAMNAQLGGILSAHPELLGAAKKAEVATDAEDSKRRFKGAVIAQFNGPITINQKFDDVDPDRVWVGFKRGMEESAERRVQSQFADPWAE